MLHGATALTLFCSLHLATIGFCYTPPSTPCAFETLESDGWMDGWLVGWHRVCKDLALGRIGWFYVLTRNSHAHKAAERRNGIRPGMDSALD